MSYMYALCVMICLLLVYCTSNGTQFFVLKILHEGFFTLKICLHIDGPPGVLGIWGEWLFIFRELGSTGNYFQGFGEQAHSFGDLGSPAKK